jgi:hypothetical protein
MPEGFVLFALKGVPLTIRRFTEEQIMPAIRSPVFGEKTLEQVIRALESTP